MLNYYIKREEILIRQLCKFYIEVVLPKDIICTEKFSDCVKGTNKYCCIRRVTIYINSKLELSKKPIMSLLYYFKLV